MPLVKLSIELCVLLLMIYFKLTFKVDRVHAFRDLRKFASLSLFALFLVYAASVYLLNLLSLSDWIDHARAILWLFILALSGVIFFFLPVRYKAIFFSIIAFVICADFILELIAASVLFEEPDTCEGTMRGSYVQDFWHTLAGQSPGC